MPEAVVSNSTAMSAGQRHLKDEIDEVVAMFRAFAEMNLALFEGGEDNSTHCYGIWLIHKLLIDRLDELGKHAGELNPCGE